MFLYSLDAAVLDRGTHIPTESWLGARSVVLAQSGAAPIAKATGAQYGGLGTEQQLRLLRATASRAGAGSFPRRTRHRRTGCLVSGARQLLLGPPRGEL